MGFKIIRVMINFLHHDQINHQNITMAGRGIRTVARKRERIAPTFSTPPGSPFRDLPPTGSPMAEPPRRRSEKSKILSAGHY